MARKTETRELQWQRLWWFGIAAAGLVWVWSGAAHAKERGFRALDLDGDERLSREEVRSGAATLLASWDQDGNKRLDEVEFSAALFKLWDSDKSGTLSDYEYRIGHVLWLPSLKLKPLSRFDRNGDGKLQSKEFGRAAGSAGYFAHFDQNKSGRISKGELAGTMMQAFDENRDGVLGVNEWPFVFDPA